MIKVKGTIKMQNKPFWKILTISIALAMVASGIVIGAGSVNNASNVSLSSTTIYVPDDYAKIQWAVDNASAGDMIIVRDGTYNENVDVNKSLTIRSENGSTNCIVQAAITDFPVFEVSASYVNISGFTVKDATGDVEESGFGGTGIAVNSVNYCNISDNIAVNNTVGIEFVYSNYSIVENNSCENNSFGVVLDSANNNALNSNIFVNNGLFVWYSHDNIVVDNTVNGKPLVYLEYLSDVAVTDDAGQVILVNCNNITVQGKNLSYAGVGIELWETNDSTISNNIASNNNWFGILILGSNNTVKDNNASNNLLGIGVSHCLSNDIVSVNNIIENNTVSNNTEEGYQGSPCGIGIRLDASHNIVRGNRVSGNFIGIGVGSGPDGYILTNNTVSCNHATNNIYGIVLINSSYSVVENNTASNNSCHGIFLDFSNNNTLTNNIANNNTGSEGDEGMPLSAGIIMGNSSSNSIENNTASDNYFGILLLDSNNNSITNNFANNNAGFERTEDMLNPSTGILLINSSRNIIRDNEALVTSGHGICLQQSDKNLFIGNNASNNRENGIKLFWGSNNNTIINNYANSNTENGIGIFSSNGNNISCNSLSNNNLNGIEVHNSSNNTLTANTASSNNRSGICIRESERNIINNNLALNNSWGISLQYCNNSILVSNNASFNRGDVKGDGINLGFSNNNTVSNNDASGNIDAGLQIMNSSNNNTITNNSANLNNYCGINVWNSNNNTITANTASSNDPWGIGLTSSSNNIIYVNNFINNSDNIDSFDSTNIWNSTEKITYTYNGSAFENYLGNYWDDYKEKYPDAKEIDGSGIWDTPYSIDSDQDNHPLKELWENYFAPTEIIFDTGSPANPYPSIMGNHTGTIKPNHTVIATRLYTYPCSGTGGHTEYAHIGNKTWNATATWEGYAGDWHSISFDKTVVLLAGESYNYTIHTGSYPQIIHESPFNATGGEITCTKFTDANGKVYYDWIPAIRLWAHKKTGNKL